MVSTGEEEWVKGDRVDFKTEEEEHGVAIEEGEVTLSSLIGEVASRMVVELGDEVETSEVQS